MTDPRFATNAELPLKTEEENPSARSRRAESLTEQEDLASEMPTPSASSRNAEPRSLRQTLEYAAALVEDRIAVEGPVYHALLREDVRRLRTLALIVPPYVLEDVASREANKRVVSLPNTAASSQREKGSSA